ncbi:MAG: M12 family metallo-peptidase, partial [Verrucomicrobiales bacterium]|nr:M12 family metallo-peptidase [Verrucomicrobiales bacterium]
MKTPRTIALLVVLAVAIIAITVTRSPTVPQLQPGPSTPTPSVTSPPLQATAPPTTPVDTRDLPGLLDRGARLAITLTNQPTRHFSVRPLAVTTPGFQITLGTSSERSFSAPHHTYAGRSTGGPDPLNPSKLSLAIVGDAVAALVTGPGGNTIEIKTDPSTGQLLTRTHAPGESTCSPSPTAADFVSTSLASSDWLLDPAAAIEPLTAAVAGDDPATGELTKTDEPVPWGPRYDLSLVDALFLMVTDKEVTGSDAPGNLAAVAASRLAIATNTATIYEYQLGVRLLVQELVLLPDTPAYTAINSSQGSDPSLVGVKAWLNTHRPRSTYAWDVAAAWDDFNPNSFGAKGRASIGAIGTDNAVSTNDDTASWSILSHEMGHNFGANHTIDGTGVMAATSSNTNGRSFYVDQGGANSSAGVIYDASSNSLPGPATFRNPREIPFANDDIATTPENTPIAVDVLANDALNAPLGAANSTLTLLELGTVSPPGAGTASISPSGIIFNPASGFSGTAWVAYTVRGDLGNSARGWLHKADVAITVGTPPAEPTSFDLTLAPGADPPLFMYLPPGITPYDSSSNLPFTTFTIWSFNATNVFYQFTTTGSASGNHTMTYVKDGTTYTVNVTYADTATVTIDLPLGQPLNTYLGPGTFDVTGLTQPTNATVNALPSAPVNLGAYTVSTDQLYSIAASPGASGTDTFTFIKGGVTYTATINYLTPAAIPIDTQPDLVTTFDNTLGTFRFNPLVNDQGTGVRHLTDIAPQVGHGSGNALDTGLNAFLITSATLLDPTKGTLELETHMATVDGTPAAVPSGFMRFTPVPGATGTARIEYTVRDIAGNTSTSTASVALDLVSLTSPPSPATIVVDSDHGLVVTGATSPTPAPFDPVTSTVWSGADLSGNNVTFDDPSALTAKATFPSDGFYTLALTGSSPTYQTAAQTSVLVSPLDVPNTGLLAFWPLDASPGATTANDLSPNSNHGTVIGTSTWQPAAGKVDGALSFDARGEYIRVDPIVGYNTGPDLNSYTVSLWFNAAAPLGDAVQMIYEAGGTTSGHNIYLLDGNIAAGSWRLSPSTRFKFFQGPPTNANTWTHIALVVENDTTLTAYIDGSVAFSGDGFGFISDSDDNAIGAMHGGSVIENDFSDGAVSVPGGNGRYPFDGSIDHVTVHSRALAPTEIRFLASGKPDRAPLITLASTPLVVPTTDDPATLTASAADTPSPTTSWQALSGPGNVAITSPGAATTDALFSAPGIYEICFTATADNLTSFKTRTVSVTSSGNDFYTAWVVGFPAVTDPSPLADGDNDARTNLDEYAAGTRPDLPSGGSSIPATAVVDDAGV